MLPNWLSEGLVMDSDVMSHSHVKRLQDLRVCGTEDIRDDQAPFKGNAIKGEATCDCSLNTDMSRA